jgi:hypothetical protein
MAPPHNMAKKKRKLTEEQRIAASERLAKARLARGHDGSLSIHEDIRNLPEDHGLHWKKVKSWIKSCEIELKTKEMRLKRDSNKWKERSEYTSLQVYIANMKTYLRTGLWLDMFYGSNMQHKIKWMVTKKGYHDDGEVKRIKGYWYDDGGVWNGAGFDEEEGEEVES